MYNYSAMQSTQGSPEYNYKAITKVNRMYREWIFLLLVFIKFFDTNVVGHAVIENSNPIDNQKPNDDS